LKGQVSKENLNRPQNWWLATPAGERHGPYPQETLADWIALGQVDPKAVVSNGGPWLSIREFMLKAAAQTPPTADPIALDLPEQDVSSYMSEAPSVSQMVRESLAAPARALRRCCSIDEHDRCGRGRAGS
jgi:hypothetical protein